MSDPQGVLQKAPGYVKALMFAVFLSLLFAMGTGADNRLIALFGEALKLSVIVTEG